jgi:hypothetical protein
VQEGVVHQDQAAGAHARDDLLPVTGVPGLFQSRNYI